MPPTRRRVITERDVRAAAQAGQRTVDVRGAAVTPSARDAARALGLSLDDRAPTAAVAIARNSQSPASPAPPISPTSSSSPVSPASPASSAASARRRVVLGADHSGVAMKDAVLVVLREKGHSVEDLGTFGSDAVDYPDFAVAVARAVAAGRADFGIMIDGAGIGSCMAANKVAGVRAALCYDVTTAANAREHNDANVLTLGGTLIGTRLALEIVGTFLRTPFGGGRHERRVAKIRALDATPEPSR